MLWRGGQCVGGHDCGSDAKARLVILDLRLKGGDGLELIKSLLAQHPDLRILILSQYEAPMYANGH